ncbi:MAG: preprotein translocase subunit SecA [Thiotrichales bacterium]|nr:MAG: preprotein translocase subunit SecA [Thiotrichales bacterium]
MFGYLIKKIFGSRNDRIVRGMQKQVCLINKLEPKFSKLSDEALKAKTQEFKQRISKGVSLDDLLVEAFATVREASKRVLGLRHYDVQLVGGMVLHLNKIAEMQTGEGKTLVATLALYLNALSGKGSHLVTVNDYLAERDAKEMGKIYEFLGLTTGLITADLKTEERGKSYACDIVYGTNNEFGFDYLRDNMAFRKEDQVQRELNFAVVDEVDSILIDEARTPLIISGSSAQSTELYARLNKLVPRLKKGNKDKNDTDFYLDEKEKQAHLTEHGHKTIEKILIQNRILKVGANLYSPENIKFMHYINAALRAHHLFQKDVDYIVRDQEIVIIDEHTGRAMSGRRWSDGLHQALEAKEGIKIQEENQTLASITFQNYFKLYEKLSGMTGTADTEAFEFHQIYDLEVVTIPTNQPMVRKNHADVIYVTTQEKIDAIVEDIKENVKQQRPVLVGTIAIEASEYLSKSLTKHKITHSVLNAKQHGKEAKIIEEAGRPGTVTIATNMAGRGTDIVLGGNWRAEIAALSKKNSTDENIAKIKKDWKKRHEIVIKAGGLHIMGSERHEARRIDNQLRGRAGRQGDPGSNQFYISSEDNLIRIFASGKMQTMMRRLGMKKGDSIKSRLISRAIENAQKRVEAHNFEIRKQLLEYDNVANDQRQVIYEQRNMLLSIDSVSDIIKDMFHATFAMLTERHIPSDTMQEQWDVAGLENICATDFSIPINLETWIEKENIVDNQPVIELLLKKILKAYAAKKSQVGEEDFAEVEKIILLQSMDLHWQEHLTQLEHLRQSVHLCGYAQKDPKQEYKREAFAMFSDMLDKFKYDVISKLSKVEIQANENIEALESQWQNNVNDMQFQHAKLNNLGNDLRPRSRAMASDKTVTEQTVPLKSNSNKVGRNEACPCNSGKKYKHCHGKLK